MSDETPKERKKGINPVLVLVPVAVIAAAVLLFTLPPTHALIVNGPLHPIFARIGLAGHPAAGGTAVAQKSPDPTAEIKRLSALLDDDRKQQAEKDAKIAALQTQVAQAQAAPAADASTPAPTPKPSPTGASDDVKRVAAYWAGMDPDKAADIARRLPTAYVKTVFHEMPADAVADIMNVMPAKTAATLTAAETADQP